MTLLEDLTLDGLVGTVTGIAGVVTGIGGLIVSIISYRGSRREAKRSADAAERATKLAEEEARRHDVTWDLQITSDGRIEVINRSGRDTAYFVRVSHPRLDAPGEVEEVGPGSGVGCWLKPWAYGTPKVTDPVEITWYADRDKSGDQLKAVRALP